MIEPILTWDAHARSIDDGYMGSISRMTKDLINFMIAKNFHFPNDPAANRNNASCCPKATIRTDKLVVAGVNVFVE